MNVLLISANTEPFPEPVFPLGPVYVGNALQQDGARVRILDMRHCSADTGLSEELAAFCPDCIGLSLRNVDNAAYPSTRFYLPSYATLVKSLRASCHVPIVLGGSAFSLFPQEIASFLGADGGVTGDGEGVVALLRHPGREKILASFLPDLADVAFPRNITTVFPHFHRYRTIGIQTARGCPNHCIYCTYPHLEGAAVRRRPPGDVAEDMALLYREFGKRSFFIVDSLFNADEDHMVRVAGEIAAKNLPVSFSCYLQPRVSDPGIFRLLKEAGCAAVDFGTDSGSPAMLASLGKPFSTDDIRTVSRACTEAGMDFCHSLLFGGPGETFETIRETVDLMNETAPRAVVAMTGVRIYPGTEMERIAAGEQVLAAGASLLEPRFYFPPMGAARLLKCLHEATAGRRNWFFPGKKDWSTTIGYKILYFLYRNGPLWRTFRK